MTRTRTATPDDAPAVTRIYNQGTGNRVATSETQERSEAWGHGYGAAVLAALLEAAREAGLHKLTRRVFTDNAASRRLHLRCGFREVGVHRRHARLDGTWRDVVIVEVLLDDLSGGAPG